MIVYEVGPFHLHVERGTLLHRGRAVAIGQKAVALLSALIESQGAISKDVLMDRLWPNRFVEESNLAQNVYMLRKTFQRYGATDPIETLPGFGYRLAIAVRRVVQPAAPTRPHLFTHTAARFAALAAALSCALVALGIQHVTGEAVRSAALSDEGARLYAFGRYYWNLRSASGVAKSLQYFNAAIDRDPQNPLGYVGLADANVSIGDYCYGIHRPNFYFARAHAYVAQALELDPQSAAAHATSGFVALHEGNDEFAVSELRRAIALDAGYAPAREWYGIALARERRFGESAQQLREAERLDPLSVATMAWLGRTDEVAEISPDLARRTHAPGHPTWASIEGIALPPTVTSGASYTGHEISIRTRPSGADRRPGRSIHAGADGPYKE
jgi:DNA-binding winged helix-turn-helix (wHTH) protein